MDPRDAVLLSPIAGVGAGFFGQSLHCDVAQQCNEFSTAGLAGFVEGGVLLRADPVRAILIVQYFAPAEGTGTALFNRSTPSPLWLVGLRLLG